jgi:kumamolisin
MPLRPNHVPIPGSHRPPPPGQPIGPPSPRELMHVTVFLRAATAGLGQQTRSLAQQPPASRRYLSRAELTEQFGASPEDIKRVRRFARNNGLHVSQVNRAARTVELSGPTARMAAAFGVDLALYRTPRGVIRGRSGRVYVPRWLSGVVLGAFGLDTRAQASPHFRVSQVPPRGQLRPAAGPAGSFTVPELAHVYQLPNGVTGAGQSIGIIELAGGFRRADLAHYFGSLGISPAPTVVAVPVDGSANHPIGDPTHSADGEVVLDIEVAGSVAPGARIVVYFAPNTTKGFLDAVNTAVHDATNDLSVISISWGSAEVEWTRVAMNAMSTAFQAANALGISVFVASGDSGSPDGVSDGLQHADFPASAPQAVGCGGTTLKTSGTTITNEVVWNEGGGATGGGVSAHFPVPGYQASLQPRSANPGRRVGRGVPDVAGVADPATGYQVFIDGQALVFGGTSAVAPFWAGLTALIHEAAGQRVAPLQPILYSAPSAFSDVTVGNNGAYSAAVGWDPCTGMGSPIGTEVLAAITGSSPQAKRQPAKRQPAKRQPAKRQPAKANGRRRTN